MTYAFSHFDLFYISNMALQDHYGILTPGSTDFELAFMLMLMLIFYIIIE